MKAHKVDEFTLVGKNLYGRKMRCPNCGNPFVDSVGGTFLVWKCQGYLRALYPPCGYRGPIHTFRGERKINGRWYKC